mmetsp:Transcript_21254/g.54800  ORF Transcript_21254/g.54800 Transcript_21254/m.54800 type:complete len:239 (+) Transcript_21254:97-813(+)
MKFIETPSLEYINSLLDSIEFGDQAISGKLEAYSCKMTADDKRLFRSLEQQHADSALSRSNSVDTGVSPSSPFGDLGDHQTRKKLVHLIATLNASYPDYDFSSAKAESFTWKTGAEYMHMVKNSIMTTLAEADTSLGSSVNLCEQLWQQIESEISPSECDIFSYIPDMDCDPLSDGKIWSFNYFFYNHRMKKVLFFTCSCTRISTSFGVATDSHRRADGTADDEEDMFAFEDLEPADL